MVKNQEMGQGVAFLLWLILIAFLDIALIGLMLKSAFRETTIYTIALLNPIELFRIAAISLFDPNFRLAAICGISRGGKRKRGVMVLFVSLRRLGLSVCLLLVLAASLAEAKVYVAEPLLVAQPSYAGMQFYVYRPYNMPRNWYVTFDGYPVTKNGDGVWVYGTASGPNLNPTNYIVGSVVPSMAGIVPWVRPAQISSLVVVPPPELSAVRQPGLPPSRAAAGETRSTWVPD